jgi:hypothetical protein
MVAQVCRIASTFPKELAAAVALSNGECQVLGVEGSDTRRNDLTFCSQGKIYAVEFKKGILNPAHVYQSIVERRYSIALKSKYGDSFAGIIFVGESLDESLTDKHEIIRTWNELLGINVLALSHLNFVKAFIGKVLNEVVANRNKYSLYCRCQLPLQLHALTTSSDGYPQYFDNAWLQKKLSFLEKAGLYSC